MKTAKEILYEIKDQHNIGTAWQLTEYIIIEAMETYAHELMKNLKSKKMNRPAIISIPLSALTLTDEQKEFVLLHELLHLQKKRKIKKTEEIKMIENQITKFLSEFNASGIAIEQPKTPTKTNPQGLKKRIY